MNDAVKPPSPEGMKQFMKISCLKNDHIGNSPTADTVLSLQMKLSRRIKCHGRQNLFFRHCLLHTQK